MKKSFNFLFSSLLSTTLLSTSLYAGKDGLRDPLQEAQPPHSLPQRTPSSEDEGAPQGQDLILQASKSDAELPQRQDSVLGAPLAAASSTGPTHQALSTTQGGSSLGLQNNDRLPRRQASGLGVPSAAASAELTGQESTALRQRYSRRDSSRQ